MKNYKASKRITKQLRAAIENIVDTNEKYSGCYFWTNTGNAAERRRQEGLFENLNQPFTVETKKGLIEVSATLSISCKNFYYSLDVTRNEKKSNISILKNMIV